MVQRVKLISESAEPAGLAAYAGLLGSLFAKMYQLETEERLAGARAWPSCGLLRSRPETATLTSDGTGP